MEYDEASAYAEENGLLFMETSAKETNQLKSSVLDSVRIHPHQAGPVR